MAKLKTMLDKLTVFWIIFFTVDALANAFILTLTNVEWTSLTPTKKVVIGAMILKTWSSAMIALFTKAASRAEKGSPIIPDDSGGTISFTKSDVPPPTLGKP